MAVGLVRCHVLALRLGLDTGQRKAAHNSAHKTNQQARLTVPQQASHHISPPVAGGPTFPDAAKDKNRLFAWDRVSGLIVVPVAF
jgi:hypothetical protein